MVAILNCLGVWRRYWGSNVWVASWGYLGRKFQAEKGWGLRASEEVPDGREQQWWVTDAAEGPPAVEPHGPHLSGMRAARACGQGHDGPELSPALGIWVKPVLCLLTPVMISHVLGVMKTSWELFWMDSFSFHHLLYMRVILSSDYRDLLSSFALTNTLCVCTHTCTHSHSYALTQSWLILYISEKWLFMVKKNT